MNKKVFRSSLASLIMGVSALMISSDASAATPSVNDECAKELLLSYFPEPIVAETLKKFNVPQDKWAGINKSLSGKDKEVVKIVEQKASTMNPNPLKDPQTRQAAVKLFRDTLLQVFTDALKENGLTDTSQFQAMLDDIQQQKAKKFAMCMEKHKAQLQQQDQPGGATGSMEDEDSDEDSDSDEDTDDESDDSKDSSDEKSEEKSTQDATKS